MKMNPTKRVTNNRQPTPFVPLFPQVPARHASMEHSSRHQAATIIRKQRSGPETEPA